MYRQCIDGVIKLFFPASCLACQGVLIYGESYLCTHCLASLPQTSYHLDEEFNRAVQKFYGKVPVWRAAALFKFTKKGRVQALLHQLKYKNQPKLAEKLGAYYGSLLKASNYHARCHAIVPVPLHIKRLRERGYNQSALLAKGLSSSLALPYYDSWLVRRVNTGTQTNKGRIARWHNVEAAFTLSAKASVKGKHILLVDDLITTGATLAACSQVLFDAGASEVSVATLAVGELL